MTTHERFRKFNTRDTYPTQTLDNDLCQTVKARGTLVFVRGQVGQDPDTWESVGVGDPEAQTEQAMKNVKLLLEEAGSKLEHICRVQVYITDRAHREPVYAVIAEYFGPHAPASTGIIVDGFASADFLVEIDATAVLA